MANVTEHHPQGWRFTSEQGVTRDWVPDIYEKDKLQLAVELSDSYDFTTIIYEVAYSVERGFFYAVCPKFLNFEALVLPMKASYSCDGKKTYKTLECVLQPKWQGFGNSNIIMDAPNVPFGKIHLKIELANGDSKEFEIINREQGRKKIVINTMQKDNSIEWVVDWLNYYRSLGVFDFNIYDNNSQNVVALIAAIKKNVPDDTSVQITHWPYRYGIHHFINSLFSQRASILDALYQSGSADWFINCDIDEYFVIDPQYKDLPEFLDTFEPNIGCVQFSCSDVMLMKEKEYGDHISIRDFDWRIKTLKIKYKNACRPASTRTASVHYVHLNEGLKSFSPTNPEAIYLHALPMTTGWQSTLRGKGLATLESGEFVEDRRAVDRMLKIDENLRKSENT